MGRLQTIDSKMENNNVPQNQPPGVFQMDRLPKTLPILESIPNEHECSYLPGKAANLPLKLPGRLLSLGEFDFVLEQGIRRSGLFLYHTACLQCSECQPSRVDVRQFSLSASMKRVQKRGDRSLKIQAAPPIVDEQRLKLFNFHRSQRGLGNPESKYGRLDYENFLVDSCCCETVELSFWKENELVAVSIVDCGLNSLSAVYTYFDPAFSKLSIGTFSILKQFEFALASKRQYVYLGMYVAENKHLNYKARFMPQERWIDGRWVLFE
jgi:leucyl-tRNA---protein transferase